jgi:hypothetical protein
VTENRRAQQNAGGDTGEPGRDEAPTEERRRAKPAGEQGQRVARVAGRRKVTMVGQLADRRERDDRQRPGKGRASQKNRRAPRKSLVRTGTTRTSLAEFGDSIIRPPPMYIET